MMVLLILGVLTLGIVAGLSLGGALTPQAIDPWVSRCLYLLLVFVGLDLGRGKALLKNLKAIGFRVLLIPLSSGAGSILGALAVGALLGLPANQSSAIGAGFGWYSLSAVLLGQYDVGLGALAFLTHLMREVSCLALIPLVAKTIGHPHAITLAGCTAMDISLPFIRRSTTPGMTMASVLSGVVLSALVPILVPLLYGAG
jgi:uncharacterized membrane protein YbjE (DUF340 family)